MVDDAVKEMEIGSSWKINGRGKTESEASFPQTSEAKFPDDFGSFRLHFVVKLATDSSRRAVSMNQRNFLSECRRKSGSPASQRKC
jgi:hypothetical protein